MECLRLPGISHEGRREERVLWVRMPLSSATMDATLTLLEQRVSRIPAGLLEQQVLGPVRGVQETAARATMWLRHTIWHGLSAFSYTGPGGIRFAC
jgi:hypothetical protein